MTTTKSRTFKVNDPVRILEDFQTSKGLVQRGSIGSISDTYYDWQHPKVRVVVYGIGVYLVIPPETVEYHKAP